MKKIVLVYGFVSGFIVSAMLAFTTVFCYSDSEFKGGGVGSMILGFTVMFLAFAVNFVGIKNFRDKYNGGTITFGKAFLTGLYMVLITSTLYVVVWAIDVHFFVPDFMEKYAAHSLEELKASGASAEKIDKMTGQIEWMRGSYHNPVTFALVTYMKILPAGLLATLISAGILRRKEAKG